MHRHTAVLLIATAMRFSPRGAMAADGPSDAWLTTAAKIAILTSVETRGSEVQVDTMNQSVTLFGKVATPEDKKIAETSAAGVEGVKGVRNLLLIAPRSRETSDAPTVSDSTLDSRVGVALIAAALKKDGRFGGSTISVKSVDEGTVLLAGTADDRTAILKAIEIAVSVPGVRAVRSEIRSSETSAVVHPRFLGR